MCVGGKPVSMNDSLQQLYMMAFKFTIINHLIIGSWQILPTYIHKDTIIIVEVISTISVISVKITSNVFAEVA